MATQAAPPLDMEGMYVPAERIDDRLGLPEGAHDQDRPALADQRVPHPGGNPRQGWQGHSGLSAGRGYLGIQGHGGRRPDSSWRSTPPSTL